MSTKNAISFAALLFVVCNCIAVGATTTYSRLAAVVADDYHTPSYYDTNVRYLFKQGNWESGKRLLDEGLKRYPTISSLNELAGRYYYHKRAYDDARYYLVISLRDNDHNVEAKQLLINVEEDTHNYSSAICYVNELLEIHPYWKGLWRRKIELYRKQKNDVEADRLLRRLCLIYPNDIQLKKDLKYRLEERVQSERKSGDLNSAIKSLTELVGTDPYNEENYLILCNLLLQQGRRSEAIDVADRGVSYLPQSNALIMKKAGVLAEDNRYGEAMFFLERMMKTNHSAQLTSFYNNMQEDAACSAMKNDAYNLYGKIYERSKSQEALDYLVSTSMTRGYYEDALYYIGEQRKRRGDTEDLLYKAYVVNKRMGNDNDANKLLERIHRINPNNKDVADELARQRFQRAIVLMSENSYGEALPLLEFAINNATDDDVRESAYNRMVNCNVELHRYSAAERVLADFDRNFPHHTGMALKRADILLRSGRVDDALSTVYKAYQNESDALLKAQYVNRYEEIAIPHIKGLMASGAAAKAFSHCERLLEICPESELGLHYAVNATAVLKRWDEHRKLVALGFQRFNEDNFFAIKQAAIYTNTKQYSLAENLLRLRIEDYLGDSLLIAANSKNSCSWATDLIDMHKADSALIVLDNALLYDNQNKSVLYTKGLAYESLKQYDSAYVYQKFYQPSFGEWPEFKRHLDGLLARGYRNGINLEYLQGRYGEEDIITAVATLEYIRKLNARNNMAVRFNYAGRDGSVFGVKSDEQESGGTGVQLQGEWTHIFNDKWQGTGNIAFANKYFPQIMSNIRLQRSLKNDWELEGHVGIRRINSFQKVFKWIEGPYNEYNNENGGWGFDHWRNDRMNLYNLGFGITKTYEPYWFNSKVDGYYLNSRFYFSLSAQAKYYVLDDGKTCIHALGSVGSAPEATMINYAMPSMFNKLNTQVGLGGQYRVCSTLTLGVLGTWYTYYTQNNYRSGGISNYTDVLQTFYKNLYNINVQVLIAF